MFLIEESPIGPCVVFMAPKTGATSLTEMAKGRGIQHRTSNWSYSLPPRARMIPDFHEINVKITEGWPIVLTVRDPRTRLLSLWRHYCNDRKCDVTLEEFITLQTNLYEFFRDPLHVWYSKVLKNNELSHRRPRYELHFLRLENFAADVERLLGWDKPVHTNKTKHGTWQEYEKELNQTTWWKDDLEIFGSPESRWNTGLNHEKGFWTEWAKDDIKWVKEIRNIEPIMRDLVSWTESTEVLDVASGAVSMFGRLYDGIVFKIVQADALESWFADLVPDRPNESHQVKGEDLKKYFGDRKFDAVVSSNGIDHSADPKAVLENMAAVSKGPIYLEHYRNCAVLNHWEGLHQWNFDIREGRVILWSQGIQLDVANILGITNWESGLKKIGEHWVVWFKGWKS